MRPVHPLNLWYPLFVWLSPALQEMMKRKEQMANFESDAEILASATAALPHLHAFRIAKIFDVTRRMANLRLKAMQELGLVERMANGQWRILPIADA